MQAQLAPYNPVLHLKRLKKAGVSETLAEIHVEETEKAINTQFLDRNLATHTDIKELEAKITTTESKLEVKIEQTRNQTLIWTFGMMFSLLSLFASFIFTLIAKGFHWF